MLDLGIVGKDKTEDYKTKFLNELTPGEELSGEIYIGELKSTKIEGKEVYEFYITITGHQNQEKWVCGFITSYYPEKGTVYDEKGGKIYNFIDSLNHIVNNTPRDVQANYSLDFKKFRKAVNANIFVVTVKTTPPVNPHEKSVNLEVVSAQYNIESKRRVPATIDDIVEENPIVRMGYINLRNKGDRITLRNIAFELKSMLNNKFITEEAYKEALKELKMVEKGS
jgi:hypothetical protein